MSQEEKSHAISLKPSGAKKYALDFSTSSIRETIRDRYESEKERTATSKDPLVLVHSRKSNTTISCGLRSAKSMIAPVSVSAYLVSQTLMHKVIVLLSREADLVSINSAFGELQTIESRYGVVSDLIESIDKFPSPFGESQYTGKEAQYAMADSHRKIVSSHCEGTGLEQIETVTFGFGLVLGSECSDELTGTTAKAKELVKLYRNYLAERRIMMDAWMMIAKRRAGI